MLSPNRNQMINKMRYASERNVNNSHRSAQAQALMIPRNKQDCDITHNVNKNGNQIEMNNHYSHNPYARERSISSTNIDFDSIEPYDVWKENSYDPTATSNAVTADSFEPYPINNKPRNQSTGKQNRPSVTDDSNNSRLNCEMQSESRKRRKKPNGMPKRPLSAYNLFFQAERARILNEKVDDTEISNALEMSAEDKLLLESVQILIGDTPTTFEAQPGSNTDSSVSSSSSKRSRRTPHGKIGFSDLGKRIGARWQSVPPHEKKKYQDLAQEESERYQKEMKEFKDAKSGCGKKKRKEAFNSFTSPKSVLEKYSHYFNNNIDHNDFNDTHDQGPPLPRSNSYYPSTPSPPNLPPFTPSFHSPTNGPMQQPQRLRSPIPQYTMNIPDSHGQPRPYSFTYAAVPMSPRSAEHYLASVTQQQEHISK